MLKELVIHICEAKLHERIEPVLATELELKNELTRRGLRWSPKSFGEMLQRLERDDEIKTHRLLRYNGYSITYADTTKTTTKGIFATKEGTERTLAR